MFIVAAFDSTIGRNVVINRDGSMHVDLELAEMMTARQAAAVAKRFGGTVLNETDLLDQADAEDDNWDF